MSLISFVSLTQSTYPVAPFFNHTFPKSTPGPSGAWEVVDLLPNTKIASPLKVIQIPDAKDVLVLSKIGEVWKVNIEDKTEDLVLDIKDRCMKLGEGGSVGMALHPQFNTGVGKDFIFLFYRYKLNPEKYENIGFNRLSKFAWDESSGTFNSSSEEILIQQYDRHIWHNGGALFFDNEGYLFVSVGDEGNSTEMDITQSTQRIDKGFFSGLLRIDVDNDMSRSHPIRRQPISLGPPPSNWGDTYSQGYSIPNDNPWLDSNGAHLEEFYAIGLRAPYSAFYDELEDRIWVSDVGSDKLEEINLVTKGSNYQWPFVEGDLPSDTYDRPEPTLGEETAPYYFYARDIGTAIVGGAIYRGQKFPSLDEKFIFGDYSSKKIMLIDQESDDDPMILINDIRNFGIKLPDKPGVAGVGVLHDGTVLITVISGSDFLSNGKILSLQNRETIPDPPSKLSELNVFRNLQTREATEGFIPYEVNTPLWSDRAIKRRWVAIPNDGTFDKKEEQIEFRAKNNWDFPKGTVFMKHFDLPLDTRENGSTIPLETRFFIIGEDGIGYGLTYKWNEEGSDAFLQQSRSYESFEITEDDSYAYDQVWDYPSRTNCMTCHNSKAGFVLGMNTHQMNRLIEHPNSGFEVNQLSLFNDLNIFNENIGSPEAYDRSFPLESKEASLDVRIWSYLDANCSFCHRAGGSVTTSNMDLRFQQAFASEFIVRLPTASVASSQEFIVRPGDHRQSEIWLRDATRNTNQMPPLASNLVDQSYVDSLAKWIDQLSQETLVGDVIKIGPNPLDGFLRLDVGDAWLPEYNIRITDMNGILRIHTSHDYPKYFLDLSSLEAGGYVLEISNNNLRHIEKLIVL